MLRVCHWIEKFFIIFLLVKGDPSNVNKKKCSMIAVNKIKFPTLFKSCFKTINLKCETYFENNVKFYFDMFNVIRNIQEYCHKLYFMYFVSSSALHFCFKNQQ